MSKVLIITSTNSLKHNSGIAFSEIVTTLKDKSVDFDTFICDLEKYSDCSGCRACLKKGHCCKRDRVSNITSSDYKDFIFICPAYFFGLKSDISRFIDRLYCRDLTNVRFHFLVFTGSSGKESGIDCIEHRLSSIDDYCGTKSTLFQIVTKDKLLSTKDYYNPLNKIIKEVMP